MGGCCNSNEVPTDAMLVDTETYAQKRKRKRTASITGSEIIDDGNNYNDNDTDSADDSATESNIKGKKGRKIKKKFKSLPPERDESFIESSPDINYNPPQSMNNSYDDTQYNQYNDSNVYEDNYDTKMNGIDADIVDDLSFSTDIEYMHDDEVEEEEEEEDINRKLSEEEELLILGFRMYTCLDIKDRKWKLRTYKSCFLGNECVDWLLSNNICLTRNQGIKIGIQCIQNDMICHVEREHDFKDAPFFYKFIDPLQRFNNVSTKYGSIIKQREIQDVSIERLRYVQDLKIKCMKGLDIKDRKYRLKVYPSCFVGEEAVNWMIKNNIAASRNEAVELGQLLMDYLIIQHVTQEHKFKDDKKFYEFINDASEN